MSDHVDLSSWPEGTRLRLICRRERPHPGAQFCVFDSEGYRHTAFITDQEGTDIAALELRHRRRARVEDAIRVAKDTGMRKLPFTAFAHNQAWLEVSLVAQALLRWGALLCLDGELALTERKRVRQRLLHVAGRVVRSGRAGDLASAAHLALGRCPSGRLRKAAGACRSLRARSHRPASPAPTPFDAPADPGLPASGRRRSDSPATDHERNARAVLRNRPGTVTYFESAITPRGAKTVNRG